MLDKALPFIHRYIELILRRGIALKQAVLYGSVVSGTASPESDIDLKLFVRYKSDIEKVLKIENEVNEEIVKQGFKFYISSNVSTEVNLDNIKEGILLWGSPILVNAKKENLLKKHIITYNTDRLRQVKRAELSRRLLGYTLGNKYSFKGILDDTDSKRLRNAIICDDSLDILRILKSYREIEVEDSTVYIHKYSKFIEKRKDY